MASGVAAFKSREAIDQAAAKILDEHDVKDLIDYRLDSHPVPKETYGQRGRPRSGQKATCFLVSFKESI